MPFELRQLRHLLAVAEHGSFGRAAAALGMTQPALSRSIKLLERAAGGALFVRSAQGVTPSDQGRLLIARARDLVRAADEFDRAFVRRGGPGAGQVVVGAGPYPAETIVPAAVSATWTTLLTTAGCAPLNSWLKSSLSPLPKSVMSHPKWQSTISAASGPLLCQSCGVQ